ncbi:SMRP1 protein, partial [Eolophus roseicapillus]|nr:SMRP1 protein [Eolophus roseicapilla]
MFLFSKKHKTPVSTYTDSYRPPCSVKKAMCDWGLLEAWKENKFVTQGLTMPPRPSPTIQAPANLRAAMREYYKSTMYPAACSPGNFTSKGTAKKYRPAFVNENKYMSWRTSPSTTAWSMESSSLPLLPKETRMNTLLYSIPMMCPLRPTCLNQYERLVVPDMMHKVPVYTVTGRIPFQSYYFPCSGRHCCLRGIDYILEERAVRATAHSISSVSCRSIPCCHHQRPRAMFRAFARCRQPSSQCRMPRWDTGFFTNTAGVQRASYTIHPEFVSEELCIPAY